MEGPVCVANVADISHMSRSMDKEDTFAYEKELATLESLGWNKRKQNIKMLNKTGGNVELIISFFETKKKLKDAVKENKSLNYEKDLKRKITDNADKLQKQEMKAQRKLAKAEIKAQKHEEKFLKKEEKAHFKAKKFAEKQEKKELKVLKHQEKKVYKHLHRAEKKDRKELVLPGKLETVILDGNNMLFVLDSLRKFALKRASGNADALLLLMAKQWLSASPEIKHCTLIFDSYQHSAEEARFRVCTARPTFPTSDDAIVDWIHKMDPANRPNVAVFTSDRGLTERITTLGAVVYKPKVWFYLASKALPIPSSENNNNNSETPKEPATSPTMENLNQWGDEWLALHMSSLNLTK